jgi:hypothetical protein
LSDDPLGPVRHDAKVRQFSIGITVAHWDSLCGCDFFSVEALSLTGTVRYMVFFVIG